MPRSKVLGASALQVLGATLYIYILTKQVHCLPSVIFLPQKKDRNAHGIICSSHGQAFFRKSLAEIYFPVKSPLGQQIIYFAYRQTTLMANYIPTSCTNAYIKINNTYSLPAKCGHHIASASRVVWLKTLYICIVISGVFYCLFAISFFSFFFFIKHKRGVWEESQGKTH